MTTIQAIITIACMIAFFALAIGVQVYDARQAAAAEQDEEDDLATEDFNVLMEELRTLTV